jgi:hypothetical protein
MKSDMDRNMAMTSRGNMKDPGTVLFFMCCILFTYCPAIPAYRYTDLTGKSRANKSKIHS